jgi:hypothetical protein
MFDSSRWDEDPHQYRHVSLVSIWFSHFAVQACVEWVSLFWQDCPRCSSSTGWSSNSWSSGEISSSTSWVSQMPFCPYYSTCVTESGLKISGLMSSTWGQVWAIRLDVVWYWSWSCFQGGCGLCQVAQISLTSGAVHILCHFFHLVNSTCDSWVAADLEILLQVHKMCDCNILCILQCDFLSGVRHVHFRIRVTPRSRSIIFKIVRFWM